MERIRSEIPEPLRKKISESTEDDLPSTCSSLLNFLQNSPVFQETIRDLSDPTMALGGKSKEEAMDAKLNGNRCFNNGDYSEAVRFFSKALRMAPEDVEDKNKNLVATLYLNRASSFNVSFITTWYFPGHGLIAVKYGSLLSQAVTGKKFKWLAIFVDLQKLGLFPESLRDCGRAVLISPAYSKAWFRRGEVNVSLGNYSDAVNDMKVALQTEKSVELKRYIESELNKIMDQSRIEGNLPEKSRDEGSDEEPKMETKCMYVPKKGKGMASLRDISEGFLIHKEEPYAAIILRNCRETNCHFCFNELPQDIVPCRSCSIPLYCSVECQVRSTGQNYVKKYDLHGKFTDVMEEHVRSVISLDIHIPNLDHTSEHGHECGGLNFSAVLPSDVVLAGRILVKYLRSSGGREENFHKILGTCHNFGKQCGETKLLFHIFSVILLCLLQQCFGFRFPSNSVIASQVIVILLSQIKVNSMAIVRMKFLDPSQSRKYDLTSPVEQVKVAQAIYLSGSFYNHSCQPNAHAYFISRTLFVRATAYVKAGSQLELSYGPQVGQADCNDRREYLEDRYSFICQCNGCAKLNLSDNGCAKLNLSDLVINAYRCGAPNCFGAVLDADVAKHEKEKVQHLQGTTSLKDYMLNDGDIRKVVGHVFEQTSGKSFEPEHCLSCGTYRDIQTSKRTISEAEIYIKRLQEGIASGKFESDMIQDALKSLKTLRTILHPFNKRIAKAEDDIAQAFCLVREMKTGLNHCQVSIKILEKLYGKRHIVIGNELIKVASLQICIDKRICSELLNRMSEIFVRHYGRHTGIIFPHLQFLLKETKNSLSV